MKKRIYDKVDDGIKAVLALKRKDGSTIKRTCFHPGRIIGKAVCSGKPVKIITVQTFIDGIVKWTPGNSFVMVLPIEPDKEDWMMKLLMIKEIIGWAYLPKN